MTIATRLAAWGVGELDVPPETRRAAQRHLLDGFGTALAAVRLRAAEPAVQVALGLGGPPEAGVIGCAERIGAPAAALANGTLVHALDYDDTHAGGLVHATAVVLPAAFAVGQQCGATGRQVLEAAVVGYEVACRVAAAAPHAFHARGLHATMVAGVFSSALVAARLTGLDARQAASALGIAGSQAGGLLAFLGTGASTKQLHPGFASQAGVLAARLAAAGATGPETVFDGPHGVFDALSDGRSEPGRILAGLGQTWETERIGIKPYPVCQLTHASLDALRAAREAEPFALGDVVSIEVDLHPDSPPVVCAGVDLARPPTSYAAKFSLPWSIAAQLVDGDVGTATFAGDWVPRPEVEELARKVGWRTVASNRAAADAPGAARVTLRDGRVLTGAVDRSAGGPDDPLPPERLLAKLRDNAGPGHADRADLLADLLGRLDELDSVEPVLAATLAAAVVTR